MSENMDYLNNLIDQGIDANAEVDVEMGLLALCMRKDTAFLKTVENKIEENDFTDVRNRTIYGVIIDMFLDKLDDLFCTGAFFCAVSFKILSRKEHFHRPVYSGVEFVFHDRL